MTDDIYSNKATERKSVIEKRSKISLQQKKLWDKKIYENFFNSSLYEKFSCVLCYRSLPGEVDTVGIADILLEKGKRVFLPKTFSGGRMDFYEIGKNVKLVCGYMGVYEPQGDTDVFKEKTALCIVPGLCFSESGDRLGYGAGFYDRFLENKNLITVALSYSCFVKKQVPCSQHDVKMDYIITQDGVINCAEKSGGRR